MREYNLLMKGVRLREVDKDYRIHQQAFLNMAVTAKKPAGKGKSMPVYRRFSRFFDYEAAVAAVTGRKKTTGGILSRMSEAMKKGNYVRDE